MLDVRLRQKAVCFGAIKAGMHAGNVLQQLRHLHPTRQDSDISDEAGVAHQTVAFAPRFASEHAELSLIRDEAKKCIERSGLAGAVRPDQPENAAFLNPQIDAVERS